MFSGAAFSSDSELRKVKCLKLSFPGFVFHFILAWASWGSSEIPRGRDSEKMVSDYKVLNQFVMIAARLLDERKIIIESTSCELLVAWTIQAMLCIHFTRCCLEHLQTLTLCCFNVGKYHFFQVHFLKYLILTFRRR